MSATRTSLERDPEPTESATSSTVDTAFEIDRQSAGNISNVGGDQTIYYADRNRSSRWGKVLAAVGLLLSLAGLVLLVVFGVMTAHSVLDAMKNHDFAKPYTQYLPSGWPAAFALIVSGFVVNRVARILVGR
jgi:hypothetical protein